jgi:predicted AAA+ superfamily ATPase
MITRPILDPLIARLRDRRRFLQVLAGPRQVGKTTLVRQAMLAFGDRATYLTADNPAPGDNLWIEQQWELARLRCRQSGTWLLVLDEVQKIPRWSEAMKKLWDEDSVNGLDLRVVVLGSSPLLVHNGLSDSLAGRFEMMHVGHWSYAEMHEAFGWTLDQFVYFGGYPGAAELIGDEDRWRRYLLDSLIETTLSRDVLLMTRVDKPALLRSLFRLGCEYSSQILSFQKMMGQLQDAGNTTTLAGYLDLLAGAGMLRGISKYSGQLVRQRGSTPKLQVFNTGLTSAQAAMTFARVRHHPDYWGRLVESAVGAHLAGAAMSGAIDDIFYWRERNKEVDFVLRFGTRIVAIEVKSGRRKEALPGIAAFDKAFLPARSFLVGTGGIPVEEFLQIPPYELFA